MTESDPSEKAQRPAGIDSGNIPTLVEGEKIVATAIIHPAIYWKGAAVTIVAFFLLFKIFNLGVMLLVLGVLMLGVEHVTRLYLMMVLTNRRVMIRHGIFFWVDNVELRLSQIESVEMNRMLLGQIMGYGSVIIAGTGNRVTMVPYVANASAFRRAIDEVLLKREAEKDR